MNFSSFFQAFSRNLNSKYVMNRNTNLISISHLIYVSFYITFKSLAFHFTFESLINMAEVKLKVHVQSVM